MISLLTSMVFLLLPSLESPVVLHDFHLSKTDIRYKSEQKALQFTIHTFIDDVEAALKEREDLEYKFFETTEHEATDSIFQAYLKDHLIIKVNEIEIELTYLGKEQSDDIQGIYSYMEVQGIDELTTLEIDNSILMDIYDDQKNIISVHADNSRKAFHILSGNDHAKSIEF